MSQMMLWVLVMNKNVICSHTSVTVPSWSGLNRSLIGPKNAAVFQFCGPTGDSPEWCTYIPYHPAVWPCSCIHAQDSWRCHSRIGSTSSPKIRSLFYLFCPLSLSVPGVYGTRTINSTPERARERHIDRNLRVPHKHPAAAADSAAEVSTMVAPRSFTLVAAPCVERCAGEPKDARIQSAVQPVCVSLRVERRIISLSPIQRGYFSLVGGPAWWLTSKSANGRTRLPCVFFGLFPTLLSNAAVCPDTSIFCSIRLYPTGLRIGAFEI